MAAGWGGVVNAQQMKAVYAALSGVPRLDGARCEGRPELFDLDDRSDPELIERAAHMCNACPVLRACAAWLDSLPPKLRPSGVVAARLLLPGGKTLPVPPRADETAAS
jgi:WhiB family redox-sensing transcriptional regulator